MIYTALVARCLIGTIFAVSVIAKLQNGKAFVAFASWVSDLPVWPALLVRRGMPLAAAMAATEAIIVVAVALPWTAFAGLLLAAITLVSFAAGAFVTSRRRPGMTCSCFGTSSTRLGLRHVLRDVVLFAVAAAGVTATAWSSAGPGPAPAGIVLSLWTGLAAAMFTVFLDDLVAFARHPQSRNR